MSLTQQYLCPGVQPANADVAANYREMLLITLYLVTIHSIYCSMVISSGGDQSVAVEMRGRAVGSGRERSKAVRRRSGVGGGVGGGGVLLGYSNKFWLSNITIFRQRLEGVQYLS